MTDKAEYAHRSYTTASLLARVFMTFTVFAKALASLLCVRDRLALTWMVVTGRQSIHPRSARINARQSLLVDYCSLALGFVYRVPLTCMGGGDIV